MQRSGCPPRSLDHARGALSGVRGASPEEPLVAVERREVERHRAERVHLVASRPDADPLAPIEAAATARNYSGSEEGCPAAALSAGAAPCAPRRSTGRRP